MASRNWNPSEPTVLGVEWSGMRQIPVALSQDAEYGYTFESNATQTVDTASFLLVDPEVSYFTVLTPLVTVYERGDETAVGVPATEVCYVNGGAVAGAASVQGGGTVGTALASPADDEYILIPDGGANEVTLEFATNGLFTGKRILEVRVRYVAIAQAAVENVTPSLLFLLSTGATIGLRGQVAVDVFDATSLPVRTVSCGECNHVQTGTEAWPWTPTELDGFDNSTFDVRFQSPATGVDVELHYAALEVVWCEENRVAVGGLKMRQSKEEPTVGTHTVHLRTPGGTDNWAKAADVWYTATLCSSRSPGPFIDAIADIVAVTMMQTQGASPSTVLLDGFEIWDTHAGRVAARVRSGVLAAADDDTRLCPIVFNTTAPALTTDTDPYDHTFAAPVYNGGPSITQEIEERSAGTGVAYPWSSFYVRIIGTISSDLALTWTPSAGAANTTTVTAAEIADAAEIFDGWRLVTHDWDPDEPVILGGGLDGTLAFSTTGGDIANRYEILGVASGGGSLLVGLLGGAASYGGTDTAYANGGVAQSNWDLLARFHAAVPTPAGFTSTVATQTVDTSGGIGGTARGATSACQVTEFDYVALSWTATVVTDAEFAYYEIQRKDTRDTTYRTIAHIEDPDREGFNDVEARVGVASTYRMRVVRVDDGVASDWTSETTQTPTAGDTDTNLGCGFLMFCSNDHTAYTCVFSDSYDADPTGGFHFVEADEYVMVRHFGRDYTQSFHGTERGGVSFERTLLVNGVQDAVTWGDSDFDRLRTIAYADLPYVCVKDDLGNRWFATVQVPDATIRRPGSIELVTVKVTESTATPFPVTDQFDL